MMDTCDNKLVLWLLRHGSSCSSERRKKEEKGRKKRQVGVFHAFALNIK